MKRIYVIVPKKLNTKPRMRVTAGYAIAQAHHATVKATKKFRLSENTTVVVLQVADERLLVRTAVRLNKARVRFYMYLDSVSARDNQWAYTAIVTEPREKLKCLFRKKLW